MLKNIFHLAFVCISISGFCQDTILDYVRVETNENGQWVPGIEILYTYNNDGQVVEELYSNWNDTTQSFEPSYRYRHNFNSQGQKISGSNDWLRTNGWYTGTKYEYEYYQNGRPKETRVKSLYFGHWKYKDKWEYTYNASGQPLITYKYKWNHGLNSWVIDADAEVRHIYNSLGQVIASEGEFGRSRSTYYSNGLLDSSIYSVEYQNTWKDQSVYKTVYDSALGKPTHRYGVRIAIARDTVSANDTLYFTYNSDSLLAVSESRAYSYLPSLHFHNVRRLYYYKQSYNKMTQTEDLTLFPQPATTELKFLNTWQGTGYVIFDLNGHTVKSGNLEPEMNRIDIEFLKSGVYLLECKKKVIF